MMSEYGTTRFGRVDPASVAAVLNDNGASLATHGRPLGGEPLVRKAVQLAPTLVQARRNLVLILMDERRTQEARESLRLAIEATGDRPEYSRLGQEDFLRRVPGERAGRRCGGRHPYAVADLRTQGLERRRLQPARRNHQQPGKALQGYAGL